MKLHTTSEVISFSKELENKSAKFYEDLCQKYKKNEDFLISFAKENEKNILQVERAYYGGITDAIEGCFAFDVETDEYMLETSLTQDEKCSDALLKALEMEEKIVKFYSDAAKQSEALMADIPRAFKMVAKKRDIRRSKLSLLLEEERGRK